MILIIGSPKELQSIYVKEEIEKLGGEAIIFDAEKFPEEPYVTITQKDIKTKLFDTNNIKAVYFRQSFSSPTGFGVDADEDMKENWAATMRAFREKSIFIQSILKIFELNGITVVNPTSSHINIVKPYQLNRLRSAGVPVPPTLVTNSPDEVLEFSKQFDRIIYKPLGGGAMTKILTEDDLTEERLTLLKNAPVIFQEYIEGDDVRVYVIGDKVISAAKIESEHVDFREKEGEARLIELPHEIEKICIKATKTCNLYFTGMDLKHFDNNWAVLECNPSPMFYGFDKKTESNVGESLARFLLSSND